MTKQPFEMGIEELLVNAIDRRNAAACYEIIRRKTEAQKSLLVYLHDTIKMTTLSQRQPPSPDGTVSSQEDIDRTLTWVKSALKGDLGIDMSDDPDQICQLARESLGFDPPFEGQNMDRQDNAKDYIYMAAENPRVASELPPSGLAFWRAAALGYKRWRTRKEGSRHLRPNRR